MHLFDVYPLYPVEPVKAEGSYLWDAHGQRYLDLYGGHAVISIGHSHPHYVERVGEQLQKLGFYSNSVQNSLQTALAEKLGGLSGYEDYGLFLINSGAEAMENALKLASFHTGREKVAFLERAFHGRSSAAVAITDNPKVRAPLNFAHHGLRLPFGDIIALTEALESGEVAALVVEGIQGVGGIHLPGKAYLQAARRLCDETGTVLILDEIQAGYGRSGRFFAHQYADIRADLITVAKGMGNGFPMGGVLIGPQFEAWHGMLGTTFGGNHLACAAGLAVLEVLEEEQLIERAEKLGKWLRPQLSTIPGVLEVRGLGLMLGLTLDRPAAPVRKQLLMQHQVFTGSASQPEVIRLLPPLNVPQEALGDFVQALGQVLAMPAPA
jgi:acetylornithine/N-succinyldiaminopimelate aminotransferase